MKRQVIRLEAFKLEHIFVFIFCVFFSLYIFNGYEYGATVESVLIPTVLLLLASFCKKHNYDLRGYIKAGLTFVCAVISTYFSNVINISQSRILTFGICCVVFALLPTTRISDKGIKKIIKFYMFLSYILVVLVALGYILGFGIDSYGRASINMGGFFKDQNYLSAFFLPAFAFAFYGLIYSKVNRLRNVVFCIVTLFSVFVMGSRGSFLTILLIVAVVFAKIILADRNLFRKVVLLVSLCLSVLILYIGMQSLPLFQRMMGFESYGSDVRIRLWQAGIMGFLNSPLIGSGIGAASYYSNFIVGNAVHNSFIEIIADQGILGGIVIIWIMWDIFYSPRGNRFLMFILMIAYFLPLFFLTGYSNMTFWMPVIFMQFLSNKLKSNPNLSLYD